MNCLDKGKTTPWSLVSEVTKLCGALFPSLQSLLKLTAAYFALQKNVLSTLNSAKDGMRVCTGLTDVCRFSRKLSSLSVSGCKQGAVVFFSTIPWSRARERNYTNKCLKSKSLLFDSTSLRGGWHVS
jgi:hypothetical protein